MAAFLLGKIMQKEIEKIFVDLIQQSLNLPDNYGKDAQGNVYIVISLI